MLWSRHSREPRRTAGTTVSNDDREAPRRVFARVARLANETQPRRIPAWSSGTTMAPAANALGSASAVEAARLARRSEKPTTDELVDQGIEIGGKSIVCDVVLRAH